MTGLPHEEHWDYPVSSLSLEELDQHYDDCVLDLASVANATPAHPHAVYMRKLVREYVRRHQVGHLIKRGRDNEGRKIQDSRLGQRTSQAG